MTGPGGLEYLSSGAGMLSQLENPIASRVPGAVLENPAEAGIGQYIAPALGAYGLYDVWKNKGGTSAGALQGIASGAAIGSPGGPIGMGIGAALGGIASLFGGKSRTRVEEERRKALAEQGIDIGPIKAWENNRAFADSRNESDLTGGDISNAASLYGLFGGKWGQADPALKAQIADEALKRGLVREHHGTIDINANNDFLSYAQSVLGQQQKQAGPARKKSTKAPKKETTSKADPNISLSDIMPVYKAPSAQAEPDNDYKLRFAEYLKNRGGYA